MPVLLSTAYFPPIQYFIALADSLGRCNFRLQPRPADSFSGFDSPADGSRGGSVDDSSSVGSEVNYIEACENYQKQSYRNRCEFYAASGKQSLTVPVVHEGGTFSHPITEIKIDYSKPWLQQHTRAIVSAYHKAAYFDYYWDGINALLERRPETLWELNLSLIHFFLNAFGLPVELRPTESFVPHCDKTSGVADLREAIHPKRLIPEGLRMKKPYFQVFACKHGFIPNLSAMDLLFNEGPDSVSWLL